MDRQAFTTGQLVPNAQLLGAEKAKLVGLGYALNAVMGENTVVYGLACSPTPTPSLSVVVGPGSIMTKTAIDGVAYSDLGTDSNATVKQGILQEPGVTLTLTPPSTAGYSQVYLVQAKQSDVDTSTTVPFYNASNPAQPYNGPSNSGNATLTLRQSACVVSLKAGAAATTGSQVAPSPDAGNVGLYTITLVNGQSSITAGQIVTLSTAPFILAGLPGIPTGIQNGTWNFGLDTGTADNYAVTLVPNNGNPVTNQRVFVKFANANATTTPVFNLNGTGNKSLLKRDGGSLSAGDIPANGWRFVYFDGSSWRLESLAPSDIVGATYITTAITKTVHGTGADFANLQAAFAWLSAYRITTSGSVTFQLASGQFVYNTSVSFYHPDGPRIFVQGATLKTAQPAASSLTYSGNSSAARSSDKTSNLTTLRTVYATEIALQGGAGISGSGFLGNFQDILVSSDGTGSASALTWLFGNLTITRGAFVGSGGAGINLGATYCLFGGTIYAMGNAGNGASAALGGQMALQTGSTLCTGGNGLAGLQAFGGQIANYDGGSGTVYSRANGGDGVYLVQGGISVPSTAVFQNNAGNGVNASYTSTARVSGTNAPQNGAAGYLAANESFVDAQSTQGGSNGTYGYYAFNGSCLIRGSGTAGGSTATSSPAVGSVGNNNAIVA